MKRKAVRIALTASVGVCYCPQGRDQKVQMHPNLSEGMSLEKEQIPHALGAKALRTPAGVPIKSPDSIISVARRLQSAGSCILSQYANPDHPAARESTSLGWQRNCGTRRRGSRGC